MSIGITNTIQTINSGYIKTSSLSCTGCIAKYNQIIRIKAGLVDIAQYER